MKTASFFTFSGPGRISIARYAPRNVPAGFRIYRPLAPGPWFNSVDERRYRELYLRQLAQLDARAVVEELEALAGAGVEPVLLCYERPPFTATNWCHRRMVSEWFGRELGVDVPEVGI
ncbi:MAG: DUF488 family protein [Ramlibacter sp.]|nr:DUF488 family protein [Ramlibacter sp.]